MVNSQQPKSTVPFCVQQQIIVVPVKPVVDGLEAVRRSADRGQFLRANIAHARVFGVGYAQSEGLSVFTLGINAHNLYRMHIKRGIRQTGAQGSGHRELQGGCPMVVPASRFFIFAKAIGNDQVEDAVVADGIVFSSHGVQVRWLPSALQTSEVFEDLRGL